MWLKLSQVETKALFKQNSLSKNDGGFQALLVKLQNLTSSDNLLFLNDSLLERIHRYSFAYGNGGWEKRLKTIFGKHLGHNLQACLSPANYNTELAA